jgi:hypothetical protein
LKGWINPIPLKAEFKITNFSEAITRMISITDNLRKPEAGQIPELQNFTCFDFPNNRELRRCALKREEVVESW